MDLLGLDERKRDRIGGEPNPMPKDDKFYPLIPCFICGNNVFALSFVVFLAESGRRMCKDPVSVPTVGLPFECEAMIR